MRAPTRSRGLGPVAALAFGVAAVCSPALSAQSLYGISGPTATVVELTGPPAGACGYPSGPVVSSFPTAVPFVCPLPGPFGPSVIGVGDIAVNRRADEIWTTDGFVIGCYSRAGAPIAGFPLPPGFALPGPILGMGWDAPGGRLWLTDGTFAAAIVPPPPPGCGGPPPAIAVPAFAITPGGTWTDIDWDSSTGSLFLCEALGGVTNLLPGGAPGPFAPYLSVACGLGAIGGIAVDAAAPAGSGTVYLMSGGSRARTMPPGVLPAPPTFYTPVPCAAVPGGPYMGVAFAARAIAYGTSFPAGLVMGSKGESIAPNAGFGLTLSGAPPGSLAVCYANFGAACPPLALPAPVYLTLAPPPLLLGGGVVGAGGGLGVAAPIPPIAPALGIYAQWFVLPPVPAPPIWSTHALAFTTSAP